jgi:transposase
MTMKSFRAQQRAERLRYVEELVVRAGSVRQAAKLAGMHRANFQALRRKARILTGAAPARTS